jgi:hypothetical protein
MIRQLVLNGLGCLLLALPAAGTARADELPIRKSGLWELKVVTTGSPVPPTTMQQCTDETVDRNMNGMFATGQRTCSKQDIRKTATGFAADTVCTVAGRSITGHSEAAGDFNSAYTVTTVSHIEGASGAEGSRTMTVNVAAKWLGPCKADQKPGDVVMPGGQKVNVMDVLKRTGPSPGR